MLIEFRSSDRMLGLKAIGIYAKGIDAAKAACEKVYASTMILDTAHASSEGAGDWIVSRLEEMGVGEVRELDMPHDLALTLRTACSVYLGQLTKLTEKQADLLVPIEDTNELISLTQSLADRLSGQTELLGSVTFASPGHEPVTLTSEQLSRAAKKLSHV